MDNTTNVGSKFSTSFRRNKDSRVRQALCATKQTILTLSIIVSSLCLLTAANTEQQQQQQQQSDLIKSNGNQQHQQSSDAQQDQKAALEAELNSIVQQHDANGGNNKLLAAAIISRLMVDNLTGSTMSNLDDGELDMLGGDSQSAGLQSESAGGDINQANSVLVGGGTDQQPIQQVGGPGPIGPEAMRLKKLLSLLQNYENSVANIANGAQPFSPFPILPSSQVATMKRAAMKMGNYLQQQQQQRILNSNNYAGRNNFDFGLGKRQPDTGISGNILRFGAESSMGVNGGSSSIVQPVSQFGKRPSAHRYDFGLGKRVASPAYPRYDFGLGKRAPSRIRYDFGLGK